MHPANQMPEKPDKLSQGAHKQTSYPRVQWGNTPDKRNGYRAPEVVGDTCRDIETEGNVELRNNQEYSITHAAGS